jgi:hypothetical protein
MFNDACQPYQLAAVAAAAAAAEHCCVCALIYAIWCGLKEGLEVWVQAHPGQHTAMVAYVPLHLDRVTEGLVFKSALECRWTGDTLLGVWRFAQQLLGLEA